MATMDDLKWTALPERPGMQFAVLTGDPKSGAYTQMRKVPAGTGNPLHSHSSNLTNVIISGVWYTGPDASSAERLPLSRGCVFSQTGTDRFDCKPVSSPIK